MNDASKVGRAAGGKEDRRERGLGGLGEGQEDEAAAVSVGDARARNFVWDHHHHHPSPELPGCSRWRCGGQTHSTTNHGSRPYTGQTTSSTSSLSPVYPPEPIQITRLDSTIPLQPDPRPARETGAAGDGGGLRSSPRPTEPKTQELGLTRDILKCPGRQNTLLNDHHSLTLFTNAGVILGRSRYDVHVPSVMSTKSTFVMAVLIAQNEQEQVKSSHPCNSR